MKILITIIILMTGGVLLDDSTDFSKCKNITYFNANESCSDWFTKTKILEQNSRDEIIGYKTVIVGNITKTIVSK